MAICTHASKNSTLTATGSHGYCGTCQSAIVLDAEGHWHTEQDLGGHALTCPGRPGLKGICAAPCPAFKDPLAPFHAELKSKGVVAATVSDGTLFGFSRAVVEELYAQLQAHPEKDQLVLFLSSDPAKVAARKATVAGAC